MKLQKIQIISLVIFLCSRAFATETRNFRSEYLKGNLKDKIQIMQVACSNGDYSLCFESMDFAIKEHDFFENDSDFFDFTLESIKSLKKDFLSNQEKDKASKYLSDLFKSFSDEEIKFAILEQLEFFQSPATASLLNSYVSSKMQIQAKMDKTTLKAISLLKNNGSIASFNILFLADILDVWPDYKEELRESYIQMANSCENEILTIFANVDAEKKLEILNIVSKSKKISKKICGEVAENALSESIYNKGELKDSSQDQIKVQLLSLQILSDVKWTRAASLATSYFPLAKEEFENKLISSRQFAKVITNIASVASADTCTVLTQYLDFLNSSMENNSEPVEAVVLSTINALGGLGNKAAFDCLLYVTYLNYPETIIEAAKDALAQLKW